MIISVVLSLTILGLVLYGLIASSISGRKERKAKEESNKQGAKRDLSSILRLIGGLLFCGILFYLARTKLEIFAAILLIPIVVMYALVTISASQTVGSLAMSKGHMPLTKNENSSLLFIGFLVGIIGLGRAANWSVTIDNEKTLVQSAVFVIEFSVYFFMVGTLIIRPVKDLAKLVIFIVDKLKKPYKTAAIYIRERIIVNKTRDAYSQEVLCRHKGAESWKKYIWAAFLVFSIPIDILIYFLQCVVFFAVWLTLFCFVAIVGILGKFCLGIVRWIVNLSSRHVIVISFRVAIITALLLLIYLNEYGIFRTSPETTSVIEFIASVLIIPVVFEWIHSALMLQNHTD